MACGTFLIADFAAFYYSLLMHILCNLCQMYKSHIVTPDYARTAANFLIRFKLICLVRKSHLLTYGDVKVTELFQMGHNSTLLWDKFNTKLSDKSLCISKILKLLLFPKYMELFSLQPRVFFSSRPTTSKPY